MEVTADNRLKKLIVVGDRVLIKPKKQNDRTDSGLYLPPGVHEKEKVQSGYIMKTGPGYPIPLPVDDDEPWKEADENIFLYRLKLVIWLYFFKKVPLK